MIRLLGISGSLRADSFNTALLRAAAQRVGADTEMKVVTLQGIPLYDGDLEDREGLPEAVLTLREKIQAADGLVMATPEYNSGMPGVFKNALDWVSRTSRAHPPVLTGKPVALMGASTGNFGTALSQAHWLPVLRALSMNHWSGGRLLVSKAQDLFKEGELTDEALSSSLTRFMESFVRFVNTLKERS